jgi:hypothetical protein
MPMVNALRQRGVHVEVIFYREELKDKIMEQIKDFHGYIPRVNPGNIPNENGFFDFLRLLSQKGLVGMVHPDVQIRLGSKHALTELAGTGLVPDDTYTYFEEEKFFKQFPKTLSLGERVLKQNRGSTGNGIWRVSVEGEVEKGKDVPLDTLIKCTEAMDNHVEINKLQDFMQFCTQYITGENGMLVDMRFLPRIKEGELRFLMVGGKPIFLIKKVPADSPDAFSATLFSGAQYTYHKPEEFERLLSWFSTRLEKIKENIIQGGDLPLIWCADFILDYDEAKEDLYWLGEINCSCVGFTSNLGQGIEELIAEEVITILNKRVK